MYLKLKSDIWKFKEFQITKQNPSTNFNYQYTYEAVEN